jgi:hypothetical protein
LKSLFSPNVSRILDETIEEIRPIARSAAMTPSRVSRQMSLLPVETDEKRSELRRLSSRFRRTDLAREMTGWGLSSDLDFLIFLGALACDAGGITLTWPPFLAAAIVDPVQRLLAITRVKSFSKCLYGWQCSIRQEALEQLFGYDEATRAGSEFFEVRPPEISLDQIAVEPLVTQQLSRLVERLSAVPKVLEEWGMRAAHRSASGGGALFYGPPGTGKTIAAEAVAFELGLDLFIVDGSKVQSMWVGQTERNLSAAFEAANAAKVLVFIDEADGLVAMRTSVTRSTDAFRNNIIETILLLVERRTGPTIVASNFADALDPALRRRLSTRIEFERPSEAIRKRLWEIHIPLTVPVEEEIALDTLAALPLTGGEISQAVMMAACHAAAEGRGLRTRDLTDAAAPWVVPVRTVGF